MKNSFAGIMGIKEINEKINFFKHKYYFNLIVRGAILVPAFVLGYFLVAALLEYNLWLGRSARFLILFLFISSVLFCVYYFFRKPILWLLYKKGLGEEESARMIGEKFPSVADQLVNIVQLSSQKNNALAEANIAQKSKQLNHVPFENAVDISVNKKYLHFLLVPVAVIIVLLFINSDIITKSTTRIVKFNQEFSPEAPFQFHVSNQKLLAYFNEDFTLKISMTGGAIPQSAYLILGSQKWKMENLNNGNFQYVFEKIQQPVNFQIEASGFFSRPYQINLINRPELTQIKISFEYPSYTKKKNEEIVNAGNIEIPEGTKVNWKVATAYTNQAQIYFAFEQEAKMMQIIDKNLFLFGKSFRNSDQYSIFLKNELSNGNDKISYSIEVVKDQYPQLFVENLRDSILYKNILLGGLAKDDYGITELQLVYQINDDDKKSVIKIPVANSPQQNFFYSWNIDSLHLSPGQKLNYYLEVWDNDGVNGLKSTRSANYQLSLPSKEELKTTISNQQQVAESKFDKGIEKAKDLKESINDIQEKLRSKQSLDWQDKKALENLIDQKQKLDKSVEELQKENKLLEQQKETFTQENEKIKEKSEQIQKLMNELFDEETKKLFNELEKLLKENSDVQQIQKLLDKMDRKEINLEKELERTLELFKQLQFDYKFDQTINELKSQIEKQENLIKDTENSTREKLEKEQKENKPEKSDGNSDKEQSKNETKDDKKSNEDLAKEQEALKEDLKKLEESSKELDKLGEDIKQEKMTPSQEDFEQLKNSEEQSKDELQKGSPKNSLAPQKKSLSKMKKMQQKMESAQSGMEMQMDEQNLENLRQIAHGLVKLSFDQEKLMKDFNSIQQSDPKYLQLSQSQLNLQNDSKVLEDSLLQLAKKDFFMGSIVTKQVGELNEHIDKAVANIKDKRKGNAAAEMQSSMTNINNLALMLNDHYDMMMNMMANAKAGKGKKQKGQKMDMPSLGKMQQQINGEIQKLKGQQKSGRQFSEDMARLAAEQERIRKALQEMQEKMKQEGNGGIGNDILQKMEQTEMDLINKQITEQTIRRQNEITTRLLKAEKSMRDQDFENERKGETAKDYQKDIPHEFEEYLRLKEKEVELLKTMPPKLFPYYKKEVNDYFKRIN